MEQHPKRRKVDNLAAEVSKTWKKTLIYVTKKQVSTWKGLMVILFAFGILAGIAWSVSVNIETKSRAATGFAKLTWDANTEADLAGYKIYYGMSPRTGDCPATGGYANVLDAGKVTTYTISNLTEGKTYYFSVTAYDTSKNESCFSTEQNKVVPVSVVVDALAPVVAVTSPTANATVSGTVSVNVAASDDMGVTKVEFYVDGSLKSTSIASPYTYSLDTTTLSDASHTLNAKAYDAAGNIGASSSVTVIVKNTVTPPPTTGDTIAPIVTISAPLANATVSGNVAIKATATDDTAVTAMTCFVDDKQVGTSTVASPISCNWNARKAAAGAHTVKVDAKDAAGNAGTSSIIVTVAASSPGGGKKN